MFWRDDDFVGGGWSRCYTRSLVDDLIVESLFDMSLGFPITLSCRRDTALEVDQHCLVRGFLALMTKGQTLRKKIFCNELINEYNENITCVISPRRV